MTQTEYTPTTLRGTFKEYRTTDFTYKNGDPGKQIKVVLENCQDLITGQTYPEVSFNLTKSFRNFGVITDHPTLDVTCRHYRGQEPEFSFPRDVTFSNNYQKFTDDNNENLKLIQVDNHE